MIVDPDFFDHWRTRMVVDALDGDELAPMYIMRLWAHCQNRKGDTFAIPTAGIKAMCKFAGDAKVLEAVLIEAEYLHRSGDTVTVIGWAEKNGALIAAWENGSRGGRPKKPAGIQDGTQEKPMGNPNETKTEPNANQRETDKRREDKIREERKEKTPAPAAVSPLSVDNLVADGLSEATATEWVAHRKAKKAKLTPLAWQGFKAEAERAGWTLEDAVKKAIARNWVSCEAEWLRRETTAQAGRCPGLHDGLSDKAAASLAATARLIAEQDAHAAVVEQQRLTRMAAKQGVMQ